MYFLVCASNVGASLKTLTILGASPFPNPSVSLVLVMISRFSNLRVPQPPQCENGEIGVEAGGSVCRGDLLTTFPKIQPLPWLHRAGHCPRRQQGQRGRETLRSRPIRAIYCWVVVAEPACWSERVTAQCRRRLDVRVLWVPAEHCGCHGALLPHFR
jgi:hypothetical protein